MGLDLLQAGFNYIAGRLAEGAFFDLASEPGNLPDSFMDHRMEPGIKLFYTQIRTGH
jgi:hypothetical protein